MLLDLISAAGKTDVGEWLVGEFPAQVITREWVIGATGIMCFWLCAVYLVALSPQVFQPYAYSKAWVRAAIADLIFTFGIATRCVWVWMILFSYTHNNMFGGVDDHWWVDIVSLIGTVAGGLCKMRTYSPDFWYKPNGRGRIKIGHRLWIAGAVSMTLLMILVHAAIPLGSLPVK